MIKVLMLGSDTKIKGGMTTVVNFYLDNKFEGTKIKYLPTHYCENTITNIFLFFSNIFKVNKMIKTNDIIHMHMSERGSCIRKYIIFKLAKNKNKPVVIHMHGAEFKEYYNSLNNYRKSKILELLRGSEYVLTLGKNWNDYIKSIDDNINSIILRNSVKIPKEIVKLKSDEFNILFLAVLEKRKGIYDFVEIAKKLLIEYKGKKQIKFIVAGSGKEEDAIKKLTKEYNIDSKFEFVGWIDKDEKEKLFKKSHLYILPSYNEGLPMSILEAMSYGIPIISTNVGSIDEAVKNDENGYITKPGDILQMFNKSFNIINDEKLWIKLSNNSKQICYKNFNIDNYYKINEKIYKSIIK